MHQIKIKSRIHDYEVKFVDDVKQTLHRELKEDDIIIIDNKLVDIYKEIFDDILNSHKYVGIDATEQQKSYQSLTPIIESLIKSGFRKNHRLIGIGGGITQDITAFTASIMYRGVSWIFFPTTLLAQGDSCIGSKTSINFGEFKNQVGGFYPPETIYLDVNFLKTLSDKEIKSGLGEMCHYFIVAGKEDFDRFAKEYRTAISDYDVLCGLITRSLEIKKSYIEIDEYDRNERRIFNYGHSFGHAIESLTNFRIPHGIAVSYGMDMANFISVQLGYIPEEVRLEIRAVLKEIWKGFDIGRISVGVFKDALSKDKKNIGKTLRLILNKGYGQIVIDSVENDQTLAAWLTAYLEELKKETNDN